MALVCKLTHVQRLAPRGESLCLCDYMKTVLVSLLSILFIQPVIASTYKAATLSDFDPLLKSNYHGMDRINENIKHDFDLDGAKDLVLFEFADNKKSYRVVVYLTSSKSVKPVVLWERTIPESGYNGIWETMWLKPEGKKGESEFKYFNAPGKDYPYLSEHSEKDILEYKQALLKYTKLATIEATNSEYQPMDIDDAFYCKQYYYYESGKFHKLTKCD